MEHLIHKVSISEEAVFDVECMNASSNFNKCDTKKELEDYITEHNKLHYKKYFRLKDYIGETEIIYFIRKGLRVGIMQIWEVLGICEAKYWDEELEDYGIIRGWYNTKLEPDKEEPDWVEELREKQLIEERERKLDEERQKWYEKIFGY